MIIIINYIKFLRAFVLESSLPYWKKVFKFRRSVPVQENFFQNGKEHFNFGSFFLKWKEAL